MFDPYYSCQPTMVLSKPVCCLGTMGSILPVTLRFLQSTTMLPIADLERLLEHRMGKNLSYLAHNYNVEDIFVEEGSVLQSLLLQQPMSLLLLRYNTLYYRKNRDTLQQMQGFYLEESPEHIWKRIEEQRVQGHPLDRHIDRYLLQEYTAFQAEHTVWKRYIPSHWTRIVVGTEAPLSVAEKILHIVQQSV